MYLKKVLKSCDIFGHKIDFHIDENKKFRTVFGGFLSLIHIGACLLMLFSLAQDMIFRTNPRVVTTTLFQETPGPVFFSKDSYFMMFGMQDPNWNFFIDEGVYTVNIAQESRSVEDSNFTSEQIPLERCTESHFPSTVKQSLLKSVINITNLYCFAKEADGKFFINGVYGQNNYQQITISIEICKNSSTNFYCKSPEEIEEKLVGSFFSIQSADYIIDPNVYEKPAEMFYRHYFIPTSPKFKKKLYRYLKTSHLQSDNGWIFENIQKVPYPTYDNDREFFELYDSSDFNSDPIPRQIMYVEIEKSNYESHVIRRYQKIQEVVGQFGGFVNWIYLSFFLLLYPFKIKAFYDCMANTFYNFEETAQKSSQINDSKKIKSTTRVKKVFAKFPDFDFSQKIQPIKIGFWQDFIGLFRKKNQKNPSIHQRNIAVKNFLEKMDIVYILRKFLEIEKLKILLLNKDQYHLFDFFPKPFVTKNGKILLDYQSSLRRTNDKYDDEIVTNLDKYNKGMQVQQAYKNIKQKDFPDMFDVKILRIVEEDIKTLAREAEKSSMNFSSRLMDQISEKKT